MSYKLNSDSTTDNIVITLPEESKFPGLEFSVKNITDKETPEGGLELFFDYDVLNREQDVLDTYDKPALEDEIRTVMISIIESSLRALEERDANEALMKALETTEK